MLGGFVAFVLWVSFSLLCYVGVDYSDLQVFVGGAFGSLVTSLGCGLVLQLYLRASVGSFVWMLRVCL